MLQDLLKFYEENSGKTGVSERKVLKRAPDLHKWVMDNTEFLPEEMPFVGRVYALRNDIKERPLCSTCGLDVGYSNVRKEFKKFCSVECSHESHKDNTQSFIEKSTVAHGELYDYSKSNFTGSHEYITIICRRHGEFEQAAYAHVAGKGCDKCARQKQIAKLRKRGFKRIGTSYITDSREIYFVYQLRVEDEDMPFYVGKGKGSRPKDHLRVKSNDNEHGKDEKILQARSEGKEILIEYLENPINERDALEAETTYIALYGRRCYGVGVLTNKTDGGEGVSGMKHSEETKTNMAMKRRGVPKSDEWKRKRSESMTGENNPMYGKSKSKL